MQQRVARVAMVCLLCAGLVVPALAGGQHHALVIGIDQYERARDLQQAEHDADIVAEALQNAGFAIYGGGAHGGLTRAQMIRVFRDFSADLPEDAVAFVYVAGHGLSHAGDSYLIPADDTALVERSDLPAHAVALRTLTGRLAARGVTSLVWVDACRANGLRGSSGSGAGSSGDLVVGSGAMHLMFSAAPGQIASDGDDNGGPFAQALVEALNERPETVASLFSAVAQGTTERTGGGQRPWMMTTGETEINWPVQPR